MNQKIENQRCSLHSSFAETSTIDLHHRRSEQVPTLRMAFTPAMQGHLAAVEQVPMAAAFSSDCNGVRASGRPRATHVALRQDNPRGADVRERMRSNLDSPRFPRRISGTNRFSFCPASQGKVAVVGHLPAAAASFVSSKRLGYLYMVETVRGDRAR
ncbi:hypothetical protein [Sinorhizobium americanum]|uniref:hypothetical protein n=1 Tax=Sinorhizobium americanum TaxID=194963 RepID=UPI00104BA358|nr:hypothetical protein [Sinorhizobium americanum]